MMEAIVILQVLLFVFYTIPVLLLLLSFGLILYGLTKIFNLLKRDNNEIS